jgi:hypothetical protein
MVTVLQTTTRRTFASDPVSLVDQHNEARDAESVRVHMFGQERREN